MYCPPESGNIEPSSANATQAHKEITPPSTHTRKNSVGFGKGPAISLAVRKIEEPMMPLTSSKTESSKLSPRTRLGLSSAVAASGGREADELGINPCPAHRKIPAAFRSGGR